MGETEARSPTAVFSTAMQIILLGRELQRRLEAELVQFGLTMRHLGALGHLSHRPDLSYSDLARRAGVTTPSMLATVRALEELGAVSRGPSGQGLPARLEITESGRELLGKVRGLIADLDRDLLASLPEPEREPLNAALRALVPPPGR